MLEKHSPHFLGKKDKGALLERDGQGFSQGLDMSIYICIRSSNRNLYDIHMGMRGPFHRMERKSNNYAHKRNTQKATRMAGM